MNRDLAAKPSAVLCGIAVEYISTWNPKYAPNIPDIFDTEKMRKLKILKDMNNIKEIRNILLASVSRAQELSLYFKVPNQQMLSNMTPPPTSSPNELVATFINFLQLMIQSITYRENASTHVATVSIENLQRELGFLITFLGDKAMHLKPTPTVDIEAVVNQVGSFIFSYLFTFSLHAVTSAEEDDWISDVTSIEAMDKEVGKFLWSIRNESFEHILLQTSEVEEINNTVTQIKDLVRKVQSFTDFFAAIENHDQVQRDRILDFALSDLLQKFNPLNKKIKEHCKAVSNMPSNHMAPKTVPVVSLFIVNSILDDLIYLINKKSHMTDGVDDQIVWLHAELTLLGSSINKIVERHQAEHEQLIIRTRDVAYEVEFVINSLPPTWYLSLRLPQLIHKIRLIAMDIKKIKKQPDAAGEKQVAKYLQDQALLPPKQSPVLEDNVVGFEEVEREIMWQLVGATKQRQIVSIFGMPGLGKTTLANKLYNHPSVVKHFDCRAWCVSSQTYNKENMLIDILMSFGNLKREDIEDKDLGGQIHRIIKRRRYLLVIDDIWDIKAWDALKRYFPDDQTDQIGNRILFTTRNREVGLEASAVMKELHFLSDSQCWELLQRKVFQGENCPQELLDIGKKIANKCQGLPLAVVVIAGVLANMEKKEHLWQKVESNISSYIARSHENSSMQLLELSYKHLPVNLKPCFLYFGSFDEDAEIPVKVLTSLWIAERFINKEKGKSLEDVALEYLTKLIDRSLVLVSKRRYNGQVKTCKIHDLLLDMCLKIADENCFLKKVEFDDNDGVLYQQHHCLRFIGNWKKSSKSNYMPPFGFHVRSLLCDDNDLAMSFSYNFRVLKVFHLDKTRTSHSHIVIGIEHLVQLRYLAIQSQIPPLPMQNFHRLEFLKVDNEQEAEITEELLNMQATNEESFQRNNKVIQSISGVKISDEIDEKILRCFLNLGKLKAVLKGSYNFSFDFLDHLEWLKLKTRESYYSFISLPKNLKRLTLDGEFVTLKQMKMIEGLKSLEALKLYGVELEGLRWDASEVEFRELKVLKLKWLNIPEWITSSDAFSSLQWLLLRKCNCLKQIPSSFGDISTLKKIELFGCPESVKESAKEIENYQKDMGNEELQVIESAY